jgi:hypothetical protein
MPPLHPAATIIGEAQARKYPHVRSVVAIQTDCAHHQVTTCASCNGLWSLDQLTRKPIGHFPGVRPAELDTEDAPAPTEPVDTPPPGERYAWLCPVCHNDLTDLVLLHHDACTTQRGIRQTSSSPATV